MDPIHIEVGTVITLIVGLACIAHLMYVGVITYRSKLYLSKSTCGIIVADIWAQFATLIFSTYAYVMQSNDIPFGVAIALRLSIFLVPVLFTHLLMMKLLSLDTQIQVEIEKKVNDIRFKDLEIQQKFLDQARKIKERIDERTGK